LARGKGPTPIIAEITLAVPIYVGRFEAVSKVRRDL
jgi:hypothetical protein